MNTQSRLALLAGGLAAFIAPVAFAQQATTVAPADVTACMAIEADKDRLACYDAATHRQAPSPAAADAAASAAEQNHTAAEQAETAGASRSDRARAAVSDLFSAEPDAAIANAGKGSLLDSRWELAKDSKLGTWNFRAYKPVYLLPAFWTSQVNELPHSSNPRNTATTPQDLQDIETKFQISFKTKFAENLFGDNGDLWGAYTQSSRWQVFNGDNSRPFRETNYEPEVMLVFRNNYSLGGWKGRMTGIGINHQSNGRPDPLSRSWNRVVAGFGLDRENWALVLRPWWRIPDGSDDDNPDIEDYVGRGDAMLTYTANGHVFTVLGRHSLRIGENSRGAVQVDYGFPINRSFRAHMQLFHGYGESMIDYNHKATYLGLGISLMDWY